MLSKKAEFGFVNLSPAKNGSDLFFSKNIRRDAPEYQWIKKMGSLEVGSLSHEGQIFSAVLHAVSVHHNAPEAMIPAFADAVRSPHNEKVLEQLIQKVDERIQSVRLDFADRHQFISVDLGLPERVPISQAGQGMYRLISIFSEMLGRKPQVCLIDEIENGIHWTALPVVWQGIAEIAEALDIQVLATTHSRECLTAAYEVFRQKGEGEAMDFSVIQLMRVKDEIHGRVLNGAHVEAAIENDIELR